MPLEVIMPALGMAQDTGLIVAWHKASGDPVADGDVLFEVETDKATLEVEAQGAGFLTDVAASAGTEIPVGQTIALISETAESQSHADPTPENAPEDARALPKGQDIIMPTLGMAQDSGLLVSWNKAPGDAVAEDDVLFEVETDKSTMEVPAGANGFLAAVLAGPGEDIPVGQVIAIISVDKPDETIVRSGEAVHPAQAESTRAKEPLAKAGSTPSEKPVAQSTQSGSRILASPKARRLALEQGLDLVQLAKAGHRQPYHAADIEVLKALPVQAEAASHGTSSCLVAETTTDGFADFADWAADQAGLSDPSALLAGFAAASLGHPAIVDVETFGRSQCYAAQARLGETVTSEAAPELRLRDLRATFVTWVQNGPEDMPVLTLTQNGVGIRVTLECAASQLSATAAATLLSEFAGRMDQPLRHLL